VRKHGTDELTREIMLCDAFVLDEITWDLQ